MTTLNEPSRTEMLLVFELAIAGAATESSRQIAARVAHYHELKWLAQDQARQREQQQPTDEGQTLTA